MKNWLTDVRAVTLRNLIRMRRSPEVIGFGLAQPIMFVLLFAKVFGGAIAVPGTNYTNYLMAGIFAQTAVFGSTFSGSFMALDAKDGLIDRFRTLPMAPSAVLMGRTLADFILNVVSMVVMVLTGFIVGWRPEAGAVDFLGGVAILLLFAWAFSWVMVFVGLMVRSPEALNNAVFMVLFPLTFISNAFVPANTLPTLLRVFAEWNPVSALVQAARNLFGNNGTVPVADIWPMQHPITAVLIGCAIILAVFMPLSIMRFKKPR